jgi:mRNA-degrading endonuclease YafQ of YafQ-DinJ toxin-antitoxin module
MFISITNDFKSDLESLNKNDKLLSTNNLKKLILVLYNKGKSKESIKKYSKQYIQHFKVK